MNRHHKHTDIKLVCERLQRDVEAILKNTNEKALYAEFKEDEIFDLQEGARHDVIHYTLDERIILSPRRRHLYPHSPKKVERNVKSVFRFLFMPFEY